MKALLFKQWCIYKKKFFIVALYLVMATVLTIYLGANSKIPFDLIATVTSPGLTAIFISTMCYYMYYDERKSHSLEKTLQYFGVLKVILSSSVISMLFSLVYSVYLTTLNLLVDNLFSLQLYDMNDAVTTLFLVLILGTLTGWLVSITLILTDQQLILMVVTILPMAIVVARDYYLYFIGGYIVLSVIFYIIIKARRGNLF